MADAAPHLVLGTAGHIDHGKTALVRALTGVDCDRLPEEKARGITIELGFAPLDLPDGTRLSVVDVPGHERLVRTMVAGAAGIDLVLLVVAADEGVMPQTREHAAICELLGIARGVVAMTRIDLAEPDTVEVAEAEVRDLLAPGPLAGVSLVRVSARTGAGLDALREALGAVAAAAPTRTPRCGPARLAIDRTFSVRGFGTVVTGTLVGSTLAVGDVVELWPGGRRARVRGLQSHGAAVETAPPGVRTAVNLSGVELGDVARGDLLAVADALVPTSRFDAELTWLPGATALGDRGSVELLSGTAERRARVSPIGAVRIRPGARGLARVHVEGPPLALLPGDRVVLRGFARTRDAGTTLGGALVLDVAPPHRRRSDPGLARELAALARRDPATEVALRVERAGFTGIERERLRRELGLEADALEAVLGPLGAAGRVIGTAAGRYLARTTLDALVERAAAALEAFHQRAPLAPGLARGALAGALPANVPPDALDAALARLVSAGRVVDGPEGLRAAGHRAALGPADAALAARIRAETRAAGLEPPTWREWSERLDAPPERVRAVLAHLVREGALVVAGEGLWFDRAAVEALRIRVVEHLRAHGALETPAYKALIGTARKHAVPLMALFDAERLTLRVGNRRVLRGAR